MDPAESILSMLDPLNAHSTDLMFQEETLDLGLGDIMSDEFNFSPADLFSDDFISSLNFNDSPEEHELSYSSAITNNKAPTFKQSKITLTPTKSAPSQTIHKPLSILNINNSTASRNLSFSSVPKVYISRATKKSATAGTSILCKERQKKKSNKRRSLLLQSEVPSKNDDTLTQMSSNSDYYPVSFWQHDHDYCRSITDDLYTKKECTSYNTEAQNDLNDMMEGFIPDDVMLNELPNCLQDLVTGFGESNFNLNSEAVLDGLNDAYNLMADQFLDELVEHKFFENGPGQTLPNLNITDDDLNMFTQSSDQAHLNEAECEVNDIGVDIVYSSYADSRSDSFDCASLTTGCTEESSSEDTDCRSLKSKRLRSLSGSSLTSRRKRRFSSRSSLNSSDSMSDSSPDESEPSSRSSSPERSLQVLSFGAFTSQKSMFNTKNTNPSQYHAAKTNLHRKRFSYAKPFSKPSPVKKKKMKVIDLSHRNFGSTSQKGLARLDDASSHQVSSGDVNEKVLYIGDIPSGTKKSDLILRFSKFGTIEDIQTYFCDNGSNYAFITYQYSHETANAIKYGNKDSRHTKFNLSYGKRRSNSYKDLDSYTESSLDFRIDADKTRCDFDALLRSTTLESRKLKNYP